jgi:hypothetical protein
MVRLWLAMGVGVVFLLASGVVSSMARAQPTADPLAVITAYEMARNRHDLDIALTYFADNASVSQRNTTFNGKDEIRRFLEGVSARSRFVVVSDRKVSGNHVTWTERTGSAPVTQAQPGRPPPTGGGFGNASGGQGSFQSAFSVSVEAVVQDGKIQNMAYTFGTPAQRVDVAGDGRPQLPAAFGLGVVLAVFAAVVVIGSTGVRRASPANSSLQGRLLQGLQGWSAARQ